MTPWYLGQRIRATGPITESGEPDDRTVHAVLGDLGTVVHVPEGEPEAPTVRFDRTGTATRVDPDEIEAVH